MTAKHNRVRRIRKQRRVRGGRIGRKIEEKFFEFLMILSTVIIGGSLLLIIASILVKGLPAISWEMITKPPTGAYYLGAAGGGILNAILGSLYIGIGSVLIALTLSLPISLYLHVYRKRNSRIANLTRLVLDVLWGIPSIVYGAFGFLLMIKLGMRASLLAGMITVALFIFPILSRAIDETLCKVPGELRVVAYTLGSTPLEYALRVVLRQGLSGILTAVIIAFGRAIGDAAAVLFTAGFTDKLPESLSRPAATLPLAIFFQLGTPYPSVQNKAYASALVLTVIILCINFFVRFVNKRFSRNVIK